MLSATSIASYPNSPLNENPVHSKAHCRHLSLNHDNKPPRYNSQDRNLDLPPRQPVPAAYKLTLTSHRNTGHQQHHAQQKHRATKAASDAKARAPPPMKYAADYRHWIRFASLSAVSGTDGSARDRFCNFPGVLPRSPNGPTTPNTQRR
jgi:hypothetical protein